MWLIIFILLILALLSWAWLMAGRKMRIYILISNGIGVAVILAMLIVIAVGRKTEQKDSEKYDITQGTILSSVVYQGEEDGYYIIGQSGMFFMDYLAIPTADVELSAMCHPGASVKLYREKGTHIVYDGGTRVELKDGGFAYLVDSAVSIKFDAGLEAFWVMVAAGFLLFANSIICLIIAVAIAVHKKKLEKKENSQETN